MWALSKLEDYTRQIQIVSSRQDMTERDKWLKIFEYVRDIHLTSIELGKTELSEHIRNLL